MNNRPVCRECKTGFLLRQYSESELNNQISYFRYMFDLEAHSEARKYISNTRQVSFVIRILTLNFVSQKSKSLHKLKVLIKF